MQPIEQKPFGKLRNFFWPVHSYEHKKLIPMLCLFFIISFIYNILRCMKITLVVTHQDAGAAVIPFLKVWAVLPSAVLLTYLYTKLTNILNREQVFYVMLLLFLGFFTLFLTVLYPNRELLELTAVSQFLQSKLPEGLNGFIAMIQYWPLSLFYVLSELWGAVVLSMLFWGFANEVTSVDEAKRFYAIFAIGANFSGIFSGQSGQFLTVREYMPNFPFGNNPWEQTLALQLGVVLCLGLVVIILFRSVNRNLVKASENPTAPLQKLEMAKSPKLSLKECFSYLAKSRYIMFITLIVVAYNIVFNISDVLFTAQIKLRYSDAGEFNAYMNNIASITGVFATISGLLLSGNVIRRYGWTATAIITPLILLLGSLGFFGCMLIDEQGLIAEAMYAFFNVPIAQMILIFGSAQICLGRAAKYTVFDETKEIAFIPLSKENQRKGKAVVDGIASRFGKSGGSILIQFLLVFSGELMSIIPYLAMIFFTVIGFWILAVRGLGKMVKDSIDQDGLSAKKGEKSLNSDPSGMLNNSTAASSQA
jgi:AAA family ATP:ADP antiporter